MIKNMSSKTIDIKKEVPFQFYFRSISDVRFINISGYYREFFYSTFTTLTDYVLDKRIL